MIYCDCLLATNWQADSNCHSFSAMMRSASKNIPKTEKKAQEGRATDSPSIAQLHQTGFPVKGLQRHSSIGGDKCNTPMSATKGVSAVQATLSDSHVTVQDDGNILTQNTKELGVVVARVEMQIQILP